MQEEQLELELTPEYVPGMQSIQSVDLFNEYFPATQTSQDLPKME
jgi:hypothetical protein